MAIYPVQSMVDGKPTFEKPLDEILAEIKVGGAFKILDPVEYVTDRQRAWYKGVVLPHLVKNDENGETTAWWDTEIKKECNGLEYLKKETFFFETMDGARHGIGRLTTKNVGKRNMTAFLEEILSKSLVKGWGISPPDETLRKKT